MTYSCSDFTDDIVSALKIDTDKIGEPDCDIDPSDLADAALAEITRLQKCETELKLLQTDPATRVHRVRLAATLLRTARNHLRIAGAKNAAQYVQRALKSVEGAERHALRKEREEMEAARAAAQ